MRLFFVLTLVLLSVLHGNAQAPVIPVDSVSKDTLIIVKHSVRKATLLSTFLPGAGQVYNHKVWKVPIIYAAFGTMAYLIQFNNKRYHQYNDALIARLDSDPATVDNSYQGKYSDENLRTLTDYYHRNRDFSVVITVLVYALNIIDAHVDAHLYSFDISDDLSLQMKPVMQPVYLGQRESVTGGLQLTLRF